MIADFKDRADAGRQLAAAVVHLGLVDPLVLALPRGGVPVAAERATAQDIAEIETAYAGMKLSIEEGGDYVVGPAKSIFTLSPNSA